MKCKEVLLDKHWVVETEVEIHLGPAHYERRRVEIGRGVTLANWDNIIITLYAMPLDGRLIVGR